MPSDGFIQQLVRRDLLPADEISETYCVVAAIFLEGHVHTSLTAPIEGSAGLSPLSFSKDQARTS